jgi:hypothetical protein
MYHKESWKGKENGGHGRRLSTICVMRLLQNFVPVRPFRPSLVLRLLNHGWAGGGRGTTGSPGLSQALGVGSHLSLRLDLLLFCKGILKQHFFNMGRSEIERPPWDFSSFSHLFIEPFCLNKLLTLTTGFHLEARAVVSALLRALLRSGPASLYM